MVQRTFAALLLAAGTFLASPASAQEFALESLHTGSFTISFGTGPGGGDELRFEGFGSDSLNGDSSVTGYSVTVPNAANPTCFDIVFDQVILTDAHSGHELWIENSGQDCLDFSDPAAVYVVGGGSSTYTGGTGRFWKSAGGGAWEVRARVDSFLPTGLAGEFEFLAFSGTVTHEPQPE